MKTCSKCKTEQSESEFVKSARYKDGLYPSCKTCRKAALTATLEKNPLCSRCKVAPHTATQSYCYDCSRIMSGQSPVAKHRRDKTNNTMCSKCKVEPRTKGKNYCQKCSLEYQKEWVMSRGGWWASKSKEQKEKCVARRFINHRAEAGTRPRKPCLVCGKVDTTFHHLDYLPRTLRVLDLCWTHHVDVESLVAKMSLTDEQAVEYLKSQLSLEQSSGRAADIGAAPP